MNTSLKFCHYLLIVLLAACVPTATPTSAPTTAPRPTSLPPGPTSSPQSAETFTWTDSFNGVLAPGWSWVDEDPTHWNLNGAPGALRIVTQGESLYLAGWPKNLLLRDAPTGDFEITTRVTFNPQNNFQQAAILIYQDEDNFVLLNRGVCSGCLGSGIFLDYEMKGESDFDQPGPRAAVSLETTWVRLQKAGTLYTGFYSADGQNWTELGRVENPMQPTKVGLTANNSNPDPSVPQIPADYDFFTIQAATETTLASAATPTTVPLVVGSDIAPAPAALTPDQLVATIPVGHLPFRLAIGEGAVWVTDQNDAAVYRIDPQTNQVVATIPVGQVPKGLVVGEGAVWVANAGSTTVSRIDAQTNQVIANIEVGAAPRNVAVGVGAVWVTSGPSQGVVSRIDPTTNQIVATIKVEGIPTQVAVGVGAGAVWVASKDSDIVSRIDPQTNQVIARIEAGFPTLALEADQDSVWVAAESEPTLLRIDPLTNEIIARITVGANSWAIAADTHAVWVTSNGDNTLWRINPDTNQVVATFKVGQGPLGLGVGEGDLWVVNSFEHTVWRIRP
ncbi:MAG: DUF1349 domain-containing protein [Verrucomicrobiales bacterium]|nr:DUF1349 domain-containing protein [Verrucomicrobiales bacterium]